jgi:hypothetical protein
VSGVTDCPGLPQTDELAVRVVLGPRTDMIGAIQSTSTDSTQATGTCVGAEERDDHIDEKMNSVDRVGGTAQPIKLLRRAISAELRHRDSSEPIDRTVERMNHDSN